MRPQFTVTSVDIACQFVLQSDAITLAEPIVPLASSPEAFSVVPVRPHRVIHIGMITPALKLESKYVAAFKACLGEETKVLEQKLAQTFAGAAAAESGRRRRDVAKKAKRRKAR